MNNMQSKHSKREKLLVVRLSEVERRYIRILALREGLTLREAILQAFHVWEAHLHSHAADEEHSTLAEADQKLASARPPATKSQPPAAAAGKGRQRRPAEAKPAAKPPAVSAPAPAWLQHAPELEWSKCPEAECLRGETGDRWVIRGTDAPLPRVLQSLADGYPPADIMAAFDITPLQLLTILQFASEGGAPTRVATPGQKTQD